MTVYKKRFGDRYDGRLLRTIDPFFKLIPYIMNTRLDSQNLFEEKIDITNIEKFIKEQRIQGNKEISFLHILIAALVRTLAQKPGLNRFIAGQHIYARKDILVSLAVKKEMTEESPETTIKVKFEPTDTVYDVASKLNRLIAENKNIESNNDTDKMATLFMKCPRLILKFVVWLIKLLDYFGIMPKAIHKVSPFHTSVFVTDLGSLGIKSIYHHLYEFGTTSIFVSFGLKQREKVIDVNNQIVEKKYISVKIVSDERIVDGFYYARAFNLFNSLLKQPEKLLIPPENIVEDIE
jgi:hypothetical protein